MPCMIAELCTPIGIRISPYNFSKSPNQPWQRAKLPYYPFENSPGGVCLFFARKTRPGGVSFGRGAIFDFKKRTRWGGNAPGGHLIFADKVTTPGPFRLGGATLLVGKRTRIMKSRETNLMQKDSTAVVGGRGYRIKLEGSTVIGCGCTSKV